MYVNATTSTSGSATIENLTSGKTATRALASRSALGGQNTEWIVEDYEEGSSLIALADFGNVTFADCVAVTYESSEGVDSATLVKMESRDKQGLTDVTLISDSSFEVVYIPSSSSSMTYRTSGSGRKRSGSDSDGYGHRKGGGFDNSQAAGMGGLKKFKMSITSVLWGRPSTSGGL